MPSSPSLLPPATTIRALLIRDFGPHGIIEELGVTAEWLSVVTTDTVLIFLHQMLILAARLKRFGHKMDEPIAKWTRLYSPQDLIEAYYHKVQEAAEWTLNDDEPRSPPPEISP